MFDASTINWKYLPLLLLAVPVMVWAYRTFRYPSQWRFILKPLSLLGIGITLLMVAGAIPGVMNDPWSPTRLAPIISWTRGYSLYYPQGQGPVIIRMYAPVSSFVYLPTAIASTPAAAMLIGSFINLAFFALPALWLIRRCTRGTSNEIFLAAVAIFFVTAALHPVLGHSFTMITVDSPAIGLATCAMAVLIGAKNVTRSALLAGLFVALAMWAKQTLAPIAVVISIYLLATQPAKSAIKLIGIIVGVIAAFSLLMILCFGWEALYFNLVTIPGKRDWQWSPHNGWEAILRSLKIIWIDSGAVGWMTLLAVTIKHDWRISKSPSMLPMLAAILVLPLGAIAYAQMGGRSNNGAPAIYIALIASATALASAAVPIAAAQPLNATARLARLAMIAILGSTIAYKAGQWTQIPDRLSAWRDLRKNPNDAAYRYALAHPGEAWFPKQPLATLLAEGKLYHFDEGLYAMELAKVKMDPNWYAQGLPERLQVTAYRGNAIEPPMPPPPGFDRVTTSDELPGWVLVRRAE